MIAKFVILVFKSLLVNERNQKNNLNLFINYSKNIFKHKRKEVVTKVTILF